MKKIFSMFLALMLFCSMTVTAMADSFQIGTDKELIDAGENVTVTVNLDKTLTGDFRNIQGQLKYDTDILTYVTHKMGDDYEGYSSKNILERSYFTFSYTDMTAGGFSEVPQGNIAVIIFKSNKEITADHVDAALTLTMKVQNIKGVTERIEDSASCIICKEHVWGSGKTIKAATCEQPGTKQYTCTYKGCGAVTSKQVPALGHDLKDVARVDATCTADGHEAGKSCSRCSYTEGLAIIKAGHSWKAATCSAAKTCAVCKVTEGKTLGHKYGAYVTTAKATFGKSGKQTSTCSGCKATKTKKISAVPTPKLSAAAYTFNNKAKTPAVKLSGVSSKYYTVTYAKGRKAVGTYKVTVKLKGANYSGSKTLTFKINPATPTGVKLTKGKKQFKASWKKPATAYRNQIDGYQIRYAASKSGLAKAKVYKAGSKTATSKTIKKLKSKKTYYVQIRAYNKVGKTTYYSGWTTVKSVKTK